MYLSSSVQPFCPFYKAVFLKRRISKVLYIRNPFNSGYCWQSADGPPARPSSHVTHLCKLWFLVGFYKKRSNLGLNEAPWIIDISNWIVACRALAYLPCAIIFRPSFVTVLPWRKTLPQVLHVERSFKIRRFLTTALKTPTGAPGD